MKYIVFLSALLFFNTIFSQEGDIQKTIADLKIKISNSQEGKKLKWMDSLSNIIAYETAFESDSIVQATIEYAAILDSMNIAVWHTASIIYYFNNIKGDPKESKSIIINTQNRVQKVTDLDVLSKYYSEAGNTHYYLNEFEQALKFYDTAHYYALENNNTKFIGLTLEYQGHVYTDMGDFGKASLKLQEALNIFRKKKDTSNVVATRNSLAILYSKNDFYQEAKQERDEIINIDKRRMNYNILPALYYNAAADYNKQNLQKERIVNLKRSLEAAHKSKFVGYYEPIILNALLSAYAENDSLIKAEAYLSEINKNKEKNTTGPYREFYLDAIKNYAYIKNNFSEALIHGTEYLNIKKEGKQYEEIQEAENFLYKLNKSMGNKEQALKHYENHREIKDSIESAKNVRVLAYYQTIYETEKRDLTIKAQQSSIDLLDEKSKVRTQWFLISLISLLGIFGIVYFVRSRNFARKKQRLQESFAQDLLKTQENERSRIATELHDSIGQKLLIIKNSMLVSEHKEDKEIDLVGETIKEVREMSHNLHPFQFEKLGLSTSLKNMIKTFQKNSNVFYSEDIEIQDGHIPKDKSIYIFRMFQECLTNVEKHAEATACNLSAKEENITLVFILKDNGKGFKVPQNDADFMGLGMRTIKERAQFIGATLEIDSTPNKGTTITVKIPKK